MAARKRGSRAGEKTAKGRLLTEAKVNRVLLAMGVDPEAFLRQYDADVTRGPREISEETVAAVDRFLNDGNMSKLMEALGTKNAATASKAVTRVIEMKRAAAPKHVLRKAGQ